MPQHLLRERRGGPLGTNLYLVAPVAGTCACCLAAARYLAAQSSPLLTAPRKAPTERIKAARQLVVGSSLTRGSTGEEHPGLPAAGGQRRARGPRRRLRHPAGREAGGAGAGLRPWNRWAAGPFLVSALCGCGGGRPAQHRAGGTVAGVLLGGLLRARTPPWAAPVTLCCPLQPPASRSPHLHSRRGRRGQDPILCRGRAIAGAPARHHRAGHRHGRASFLRPA